MKRAAPVPRYPRSPFYGPASVAGNAVLVAETPFLQLLGRMEYLRGGNVVAIDIRIRGLVRIEPTVP
jgi:hypothetical protein